MCSDLFLQTRTSPLIYIFRKFQKFAELSLPPSAGRVPPSAERVPLSAGLVPPSAGRVSPSVGRVSPSAGRVLQQLLFGDVRKFSSNLT